VVRYAAAFERSYPSDPDTTLEVAAAVISGLGGKVSREAAGALTANFNKKVGKRYLQNRIHVDLRVQSAADGGCVVAASAHPVDPLGRPLGFGVIGEPAREVLDAVRDALTAATTSDR
jgi:hypothetical protein